MSARIVAEVSKMTLNRSSQIETSGFARRFASESGREDFGHLIRAARVQVFITELWRCIKSAGLLMIYYLSFAIRGGSGYLR